MVVVVKEGRERKQRRRKRRKKSASNYRLHLLPYSMWCCPVSSSSSRFLWLLLVAENQVSGSPGTRILFWLVDWLTGWGAVKRINILPVVVVVVVVVAENDKFFMIRRWEWEWGRRLRKRCRQQREITWGIIINTTEKRNRSRRRGERGWRGGKLEDQLDVGHVEQWRRKGKKKKKKKKRKLILSSWWR